MDQDNRRFDIAVLGSGPIGVLTAYLLRDRTDLSVALISLEPASGPTEDRRATYQWAGGSVRMYWDDPEKHQAVTSTGEFFKSLAASGVDIDLLEDSYVFLRQGVTIPSLNVAGAKVLKHLMAEAVAGGIHRFPATEVTSLEANNNGYTIQTTQGDFEAEQVVLAFGAENRRFLPELQYELEKRQLFVMDLPVDEHRAVFPHVVVPLGDGVVFVFIKRVQGQLKVVLGQEGVVEHDEEMHPQDYYQEMVDTGLHNLLPFLAKGKVENILWGMDVGHKDTSIVSPDGRLFAVSCGSAVRSALSIGKQVVARLDESRVQVANS